VDVAFIAAHLLTPALNSGGDVLFANIAREAARLRPDWRIAVIAPDYACDGLAPFFRTVVPLPSRRREAERVETHPREVALAWMRRVGPCTRAALEIGARLVHATGDFFVDVLPAARAARRSGCRLTGVVHHLNAAPLGRRNDLTTATASWLFQRFSLGVLRARADRVFLLNEDTRAALLHRGFRSTQLAVTPAGIDLARFPPAPAPPRADRVLWVHRLEPTKGMFDLPQLVAQLPAAAHVDVVGRGPSAWRERLETELVRAGVRERVAFHGYLDDAALARLYAAANVFVSCSYEEGWGLSLAEALAVGVPCVAYELPSHREVFGDAVETVPLGDVAALARHIADVLQHDDAEGARAHRRAAVEPYSFTAAAARQVAVFETLLAGS
jgi:glycosyltransferase involved in cell wall biosynthesis